LNIDELKDPDYLTGPNVSPAMRKGRAIAILEWLKETCSSNSTDQTYDVCVDTSTPEYREVDCPDNLEHSPGIINVADRFSGQSDQLHEVIAQLTNDIFENNTQQFKDKLNELQSAAANVAEKLADLVNVANKIKTIVTAVTIVDDIVQIAAGLAKSV
jgi:hypothetical protein